jgi:hypothetical protein
MPLIQPTSRSCPEHGLELSGGPVLYWCPARHSVTGADLDEAAENAMLARAAA